MGVVQDLVKRKEIRVKLRIVGRCNRCEGRGCKDCGDGGEVVYTIKGVYEYEEIE